MREGKKLIAIADDEKEIRDVVSLLLTGEGYAVQTAEDGQCVVDQCSPDVDLYILDVNMPRLSGIMAAAKIRKRYDTPSFSSRPIPVNPIRSWDFRWVLTIIS